MQGTSSPPRHILFGQKPTTALQKTTAFVALVAALTFSGCKTSPAPPAGLQDAEAKDAEPAATPTEVAYVTGPLVVRHEASDQKHRAQAPNETVRRTNFIAQLQRGERVDLLGEQGHWAQIRTSDERTGYVKREGLLAGVHIEPATVHKPQRMFRRPDLLAVGPQPPLDPGSLVFVVRRKEQFCELNYAAQSTAWLLCAQLDTDPGEVDAAKLLSRASALDRAQEPGGEDLRSLARTHWGHTRLVRELLGEDVPDDSSESLLTPVDPNNMDPEHDAPLPSELPGAEHPAAGPLPAEPLEQAP